MHFKHIYIFVIIWGAKWTSLVAQMVKNLSAMQETWVQFLGWEDPLEKEWATHSSIFGLTGGEPKWLSW